MIYLQGNKVYGIPRYDLEVVDMPVVINGQTYYRTAEVCRMVGIGRNTLFRWLKESDFVQEEHRDFRGWRLFTKAQIDTIKDKASQISTIQLKANTLSAEQELIKRGHLEDMNSS